MRRRPIVAVGVNLPPAIPTPARVPSRVLCVDGAALPNPGPMAAGFAVLVDGVCVARGAERFAGIGDNNQAEALAVVAGLRWWRGLGGASGDVEEVWSDSRVTVDAVAGLKVSRLPGLGPLQAAATEALRAAGLPLRWVPRRRLADADAVARALLLQAP